MKKSVTANRTNGTLEILLRYGARNILVILQPSVQENKFKTLHVLENGREVSGEERFTCMVAAERELMATLTKWVAPPPKTYTVSSMEERVEISFAYTLSKLDDKHRQRISPLRQEDLRALTMLAQTLRSKIAEHHQQARHEKRKVLSGYLDDLKTFLLADWSNRTPCSQELRDFYSSVLGRAFAYKQGKVPYEQYTEAQKLLPGIKLAFAKN